LREAIHNVHRSVAIFDVRSMQSQVRDALILPRLMWAVAGLAGAIGLLLATIGVYGVMSFAVVSRRRELGIRLAIGARPGGILAMVVSDGGVIAVLGTGLGSLMALGVTRFAASLLYGVSPADPLTFILAPTFLLIVALTACLVPARAASRLNPVDVLKGD
jgi:ABC-type antimicrobial peptide transport system permease subunit